MSANYSPPIKTLVNISTELYAIKISSDVVDDETLFISDQNHFHVKIRYDGNGQRLKTPIEFNARFPVKDGDFVGRSRGPGLGLTKYLVTMTKDDGTNVTFVDLHPQDVNYSSHNVWYYPIRTHVDIEKWATQPMLPVDGELVKYKYPDAITSAELERGFKYLVKFRGNFYFIGEFGFAMNDRITFTLLEPSIDKIKPKIKTVTGSVYVKDNGDYTYYPLETIADEFRNPAKRSVVLQVLAGAERNTRIDPNIPLPPGLTADIVRNIAEQYGGHKRSDKKRSNKKRSYKKRSNKKRKKKLFTKKRR
jgi:hypothetical protein